MLASTTRRGPRAALASLLSVGYLLVAQGAPADATATSRLSPGDRAAVVIANLEEAFGDRDVRRHQDMRVFVDRVLAKTPYAPDVLLLQEVRRSSARFVARRLSDVSGYRYVVAVDPGPNPWMQTERKVIKTDTAILLNADTMRKVARGGFMRTSYKPRGAKRQVKKTAYVLARDRARGAKLSLASLHWPGKLGSQRRTNRLGRKWSTKLAALLARKYPSRDASTLGGDFNRPSHHKTRSGDRRPYPFWRELVGDGRYKDAVWTVDARPDNRNIPNGGVDHIFARAPILNAGIDEAYDRDRAKGDPSRYYSDHKLRWAVIGTTR